MVEDDVFDLPGHVVRQLVGHHRRELFGIGKRDIEKAQNNAIARHADAHLNLGRLYQLKGDLKHAKRHYELALTARPGHQLAYYNLGTVFDELDETAKAADYYQRAPGIPDAHYNLARIRELEGDEVSALRHMRQYRDLLDQEGD